MAGGRVIHILRDVENVAEHLLLHKPKVGLRCYCSNAIRVEKKRAGYVPHASCLRCPVCDKERKRWDDWWTKVEEAEREAERQANS